MLAMIPPPHAPSAVLATCISGVQDPALAAKLHAILPTLLATAASYHHHCQAHTLHLIPRVSSIGAVTKDELTDLYTKQMSAPAGAARSFYNAIRGSARNDKCPLCGIGTVKVLDHHLPSSKYPDLAVAPFNLVPACEFCNNSKKARYPRGASQQTIHPYYDDYSNDQWIRARLDRAGPPALVFYVDPPGHWSPVDRARVQRHFDVVSLGHSYTSNANDDLITLRDHLTLMEAGGRAAVQAYLSDQVMRYQSRINSWQHITYQTLASDPWFVDGGYRQIAV